MTCAKDTDKETAPQQIVANEITIVDRQGKPRIRLGVDEDGTAAVKLYDKAEQLRIALYLKGPEGDDEADLLMAEYGEVGLIMTERLSGAIRLGISEDGLFGRRPRLEIAEGPGWGKRRHRFPSLPPNVSD